MPLMNALFGSSASEIYIYIYRQQFFSFLAIYMASKQKLPNMEVIATFLSISMRSYSLCHREREREESVGFGRDY